MASPSTSLQFSQFLEAFETGVDQWFHDQIPLHPKEYLGFLREESSEKFYKTQISTSGLGIASSKAIGGDFNFDEIFKSPKKQHALETWGIAILIQMEMLDWDLFGTFKELATELVKSHTDRYNLVGFSVLLNGFNGSAASKYLTFQSEALFKTGHTRLDGGTWDNYSSAGLSHLGLQEALIGLALQVNERGRYAMVSAKRLIVAPQKRWIAKTLLETEKLPGTDFNDKNTLRGEGLSMDRPSPYLSTQPEYWFLFGDTRNIKMRMRLGRKPDLEKDMDSRNRNRLWTSYCAFGLGIFNSHGTWGSDGGT